MDEKNAPALPEQKDSAGQDFIKKIGPAGCVLFLALAVLVGAICLSAGRNPVPDYEPPQGEYYYVNHLEELAAELNDTLLPQLSDPATAAVTGSTVTVTVQADSFVPVRSAVLRYYSEELFTFQTQ